MWPCYFHMIALARKTPLKPMTDIPIYLSWIDTVTLIHEPIMNPLSTTIYPSNNLPGGSHCHGAHLRQCYVPLNLKNWGVVKSFHFGIFSLSSEYEMQQHPYKVLSLSGSKHLRQQICGVFISVDVGCAPLILRRAFSNEMIRNRI